MRKDDLWTSFFALLLPSIYAFESFHFGIGTLQNPGMGFSLLGSSALLGLFSITLFLRRIFAKKGFSETTIIWRKHVVASGLDSCRAFHPGQGPEITR